MTEAVTVNEGASEHEVGERFRVRMAHPGRMHSEAGVQPKQVYAENPTGKAAG
jgi:hypothetical protein